MPGGAIIGNRYSNPSVGGAGSSLLPAELRNLARLLKLLHDPDKAAAALLSCRNVRTLGRWLPNLEAELMPLRRRGDQPPQTWRKDGGEDSSHHTGWIEQPETEMAKVVQRIFDRTTKRSKHSSQPQKQRSSTMAGPKPTGASDSEDRSVSNPTRTPPSTLTTAPTTRRVTALISDDSSEGLVEDDHTHAHTATTTTTSEAYVNQELAVLDFWSHLMECVHLHVSSATIVTWGRRKIYQVYRLAGPTMPIRSTEDVRRKVHSAFLTFYDGVTDTGKYAMRYSDCRVYATTTTATTPDDGDGDGDLWIQINIGKTLDLQDEGNRAKTGEKKKKNGTEFLALIPAESHLVALTASRAASRSPFTPYVLSALETALTCSVVGGYNAKDAYSQRLDDLSGDDPQALLHAARAIEAKNAVGRFAAHAASGAAIDPVTELQTAATETLVDRREESQRLTVGSMHGRQIANLAHSVQAVDGSSLVASNATGSVTVKNRSAREQNSRKRARDVELGNEGDLPRRTCLRWDWKGETNAVTTCWSDAEQTDDSSVDTRAVPHTLKCRVVFQGSDVFAGMRALMEAGLMQGPLPLYVKDAASLGAGGTITVDNGAVSVGLNKEAPV